MTRSDDPERKLSEALRARATGAGLPLGGPPPPSPVPQAQQLRQSRPVAAPRSSSSVVRTALVLALLGGLVLGALLALVSLWAPGVLPPLG